jgi:hypothetical protein
MLSPVRLLLRYVRQLSPLCFARRGGYTARFKSCEHVVSAFDAQRDTAKRQTEHLAVGTTLRVISAGLFRI